MTARVHFDRELKNLLLDVLRMSGMVEDIIKRAIKALLDKDMETAREIIDNDAQVNDWEMKIQDKSIKIIATQQPAARDLRVVCTALKIITDLERIADHGADISKINIDMGDRPYMKPLIDIPRMGKTSIEMLKGAIDAYVNEDAKLAEKICARDDELDSLFSQIFRELVVYMMEDPKKIGDAANLLLIAKYLERIGDHITNICEWVIYSVTGEKKDLNL